MNVSSVIIFADFSNSLQRLFPLSSLPRSVHDIRYQILNRSTAKPSILLRSSLLLTTGT